MNQKLPFYMAYQMPMSDEEERFLHRDYEYMKSAYPDTARRLIPVIEEECDRMEYEGSMMYDEYPDKLSLRLMCRRIYEKAEKNEEKNGDKDRNKDRNKEQLWDLIQVMTFQELCHRRMEHRCYRRQFFMGRN